MKVRTKQGRCESVICQHNQSYPIIFNYSES